jgi:pimeloyl-ACP methyl ester carboxylesterase
LVLIAPAPDFTSDLIEPKLTRKQKKALADDGHFEEPSAYGSDPYIYTKALFDDGRANRVLTGPIDTHCPVHILQGLADPDVPASHALKLASHLPADDLTVSLIPDGDHRLSRPQDLDMIINAVAAMAGVEA